MEICSLAYKGIKFSCKNSPRDVFLKLILIIIFNLSVIRQKDESQDGCFKKTQHVKFSEKRTFLFAPGGVRNVRFSENLACFVFLKHSF